MANSVMHDLSDRLFAAIALASIEEHDKFTQISLLLRIESFFAGGLSEEEVSEMECELAERERELSIYTVDDVLRSKLIEYGALYACVHLRPSLVTQEHKDRLLWVYTQILH
jgi:hypothetical protein